MPSSYTHQLIAEQIAEALPENIKSRVSFMPEYFFGAQGGDVFYFYNIAGGGKIYTDVAARFVRSERSLEDIAASPYSREIVRNILSSGHRAALEFDFFLFGHGVTSILSGKRPRYFSNQCLLL